MKTFQLAEEMQAHHRESGESKTVADEMEQLTGSSYATDRDDESVMLCSFARSLSCVAVVCCCGTCPI